MIDVIQERLIRLTDVARLVGPGRGGRPCHLSTVLRWILHGSLTPDGERVRLEAIRVGGAWKTTVEAVHRFLAALTPSLQEPSPTRSRTARQRDNEEAKKKLEKLRI